MEAEVPMEGQTGTVKAWVEERGMGFIAPTDGSADVFVHRSALVDGTSLVVGSEVIFEPGWDPQKNKPIATKCGGAMSLADSLPGAGGLENGKQGTVTAWIEGRGMGFIAPADGSEDVFVHRSAILDGTFLVPGAQVIFEPSWDTQKNKPVAKAVMAARAVIPNGKPGVVKAWIEGRGMGFIAPADGSADVFVHRSKLLDGQSLVLGSKVSFEPGFDPEKGKPVAEAVAGAVPGPDAAPKGLVKGGGKGIQQQPGQVSGALKVWFEDKGFGFITLAGGMGDAFVGRTAMPPGLMMQEGMPLSCTVEWNPGKDKYTAIQVQPQVGKGGGKGSAGPSDNCYISGLPAIDEKSLAELFGAYGNVVSCKVLPAQSGQTRNALVRFSSVEEAKWIVDTVTSDHLGLPSPITVKFATSKTPARSAPIAPTVVPPPRPGAAAALGLQVQAAKMGTVKAVMGQGLMVSPSEGGIDVYVPRALLLDGDAQVGGMVSFSLQATPTPTPAYGKAPTGPAVNRAAPYGSFNLQQASGPQNGTVKAWMEHRGMGFIAPSDGSQDLFVHRSSLQDGGALVVGSPVTFTAELDPQKGKPIATNVFGAVQQQQQ
ncbi:unnamed protein product [Effrenium voratum]|nr:unnamed protein product [Effrenium voratum]